MTAEFLLGERAILPLLAGSSSFGLGQASNRRLEVSSQATNVGLQQVPVLRH